MFEDKGLQLVYSAERDGRSLEALYRHCSPHGRRRSGSFSGFGGGGGGGGGSAGAGAVLLVVEALLPPERGGGACTVGAFLSHAPAPASGWRGDRSSFLFALTPLTTRGCYRWRSSPGRAGALQGGGGGSGGGGGVASSTSTTSSALAGAGALAAPAGSPRERERGRESRPESGSSRRAADEEAAAEQRAGGVAGAGAGAGGGARAGVGEQAEVGVVEVEDGVCEMFMLGTHELLAVGGSGTTTACGLRLDADLTRGSSERCQTFGNAPLVGGATDFEVGGVEVFVFKQNLW